MNLLNMYGPSVDRIYGQNLPELRASFHEVLSTLSYLHNSIKEGIKECAATSLIYKLRHHFDVQAITMERLGYYNTRAHEEKHEEFLTILDDFEVCSSAVKTTIFYTIHRWIFNHLLMDDAHFMSHCFSRK